MIAACAEDVINEQGLQPIVDDAPETLTVGFEENDTRVQLNEETKTVWTKDDLVSVFYRSDANQKWQYQGETGERIGNLKCVDAGTVTRDMDRVVVVYPYSGDYYINPSTFNVQATLPATQTYLKDSYGVGCNLMVSQSEFTQFSLKSVCGWLKLQLTGNGKVVKSIKFCGNNGEQVAGLIYVDTYTAESTLALEVGNNGGGNLIFDDTILTEVTLDCGEGVTLGAEATAFYIALPPQTFTEGFTVEVNCDGYSPMTISTSNKVVIERNHIQPMAAKEHDAEVQIPNNEIWYTSTDGEVVMPYVTDAFDANIVSNTYRNGKGVIKYDGDVTTIGYEAFRYCSSLTSVTIPNSVTLIEKGAFVGCSSLTSLYGKFASADNRCWVVNGVLEHFIPAGLTTYTIPDGVTEIGYVAFSGCSNLTSVTIPDGVTTIGVCAFRDCQSIASVTIPDNVTTIGDGVFLSCYNLTEFKGKFAEDNGRILVVDGTLIAFAPSCGAKEYTIPDSVTIIEMSAFRDCQSLTIVTIPESVTTIRNYAFYDCSSLTSVTIPDSATLIGDYAFKKCSSLTSVTIGNSVTSIGKGAFDVCGSLTSVYCKPTTPPAGGQYMFDQSASGRKIYVPYNSVDVYKSAEYWSRYASDIVGYDFQTSEIYGQKLQYTSTDGKIVTPYSSNVFGANIVSNTYENGKGIITFDAPVTSIGEKAFYDCDNLKSVTIPDGVTSIGANAFDYCTNLTSITIPDSVTSIGANAFKNCSKLTSVIIPNRVTSIREATFAYCGSLKSVTIPDSLTSIGNNAFRNCHSLASVTIPNRVTSIGANAFHYCIKLTNITIPNSVTSIGKWALYDCTCELIIDSQTLVEKDYTTSNYPTRDDGWLYGNKSTKITIGKNVTKIGNLAFLGCSSLASVTIGNWVTSIGNSAFHNCSNLTSVTIGNSVTSIGKDAFRECGSLTSATIGNSVTSIGNSAFYNCASLKSVYCKPTTPPTAGNSIFWYSENGAWLIRCKIYVPTASVSAYKNASEWSTYASDIVGYDF